MDSKRLSQSEMIGEIYKKVMGMKCMFEDVTGIVIDVPVSIVKVEDVSKKFSNVEERIVNGNVEEAMEKPLSVEVKVQESVVLSDVSMVNGISLSLGPVMGVFNIESYKVQSCSSIVGVKDIIRNSFIMIKSLLVTFTGSFLLLKFIPIELILVFDPGGYY